MNITIKAKPVFYKATTKNELIRKIGSKFSYGLGSFGIGMIGNQNFGTGLALPRFTQAIHHGR